MAGSSRYAFYGSLRRGLQNHEPYKSHLRYQFSCWIKGFQLYSLGDFPFAWKTGIESDKILVEVFEIDNLQVEEQINQLEKGYGYIDDTILIDEKPAKIYLFKDKANYPIVLEGDWLKFFRA
jgi:gamma-glutamylcyclotransferase (GGCT)/AIG2-like uncharacterized protein YtfP